MVAYPSIPMYLPSGDTGGNKDAEFINASWAAGKPVFLLPAYLAANYGPYWINQPLNLVSQAFMTGFMSWAAAPNDAYGAGTGQPGGALINMTEDFSGDYAIKGFNSSSTDQFYGVDLSCFTINGAAATEGGGILLDGAWGAGFLHGVAVLNPTGDCLHFAADDTSGKVPDDWQVYGNKFSASSSGAGIYTDDTPDSWFDRNECSQNAAHNWDINFSVNTRITNSKGEGSVNGAGIHFGGNGTGDVVTVTGFTTQFNAQDGFIWDNSAGGSSQSVYQLANCVSTHDNQAGGTTYASYRSNGSLARVMGVGCFAAGAAYGAYQGAESYFMCFTGSYLSGVTAATHDDGTNTHALVNQEPFAF
jgi:hypothetical protein